MLEAEEYNKYISYAAVLALIFIFYKMIEPYAAFLALGVVLALLVYPAHLKIKGALKHERASAGITLLLTLLIIVIPAIIMLSSLVGEMISFFSQLDLGFFQDASTFLTDITGRESYLGDNIKTLITNGGQYLLSSVPNIIGSLAQFAIGLLLMFSITYYILVDADSLGEKFKLLIPLKENEKEHLISVMKKIVGAALYGEILIAIIQGILGGILFSLLEIPNPIFWGFVMGILAFLPFVGTALVWGPVAIMRLMNGEILVPIIIIIYGIVLLNSVDYFLRPKIISRAGRVHPLTAIIGAFGGIQFFGFTGLILGPMIAALIEALITFYYEEQKGINHKKPASVRARRKAA